jgi:hypothetical protein
MNSASVQLYAGGKLYSQLHDEHQHSFTLGTISTFVGGDDVANQMEYKREIQELSSFVLYFIVFLQ